MAVAAAHLSATLETTVSAMPEAATETNRHDQAVAIGKFKTVRNRSDKAQLRGSNRSDLHQVEVVAVAVGVAEGKESFRELCQRRLKQGGFTCRTGNYKRLEVDLS